MSQVSIPTILKVEAVKKTPIIISKTWQTNTIFSLSLFIAAGCLFWLSSAYAHLKNSNTVAAQMQSATDNGVSLLTNSAKHSRSFEELSTKLSEVEGKLNEQKKQLDSLMKSMKELKR